MRGFFLSPNISALQVNQLSSVKASLAEDLAEGCGRMMNIPETFLTELGRKWWRNTPRAWLWVKEKRGWCRDEDEQL